MTDFESVLKNAKVPFTKTDFPMFADDFDHWKGLGEKFDGKKITEKELLINGWVSAIEVEKLKTTLQEQVNEMILGKPAVFREETEYEKGYTKGFYDAKREIQKILRQVVRDNV